MSFGIDAADLRSQGIGALAGVSENLGTLRGLLSGLSTEFTNLVEISAAAGTDFEYKHVLDTLFDICELLDRWSDQKARSEMASQSSSAFEALEGLQRQVKQFRLVASLTAIEVATSEAVEILDFVSDLRRVPDQIQVSVVEVQKSISGLRSGQMSAQKTASHAATVLRDARVLFQTATAPITTMLPEIQAARDRIKTGSGTFAAGTHRETLGLISAFQFSDSMAQRLEHIADMLSIDMAERWQVEAVAKAQLDALAQDGGAVISDLQAGLNRLRRLTEKAQDIFEGDGGIARELFSAQRSALVLLQDARQTARPAIDSATQTAIDMSAQVKQADESLLDLLDTSKVIDLAAVNARIKSSRATVSHAAFVFLSTSVMQMAETCRRQIQDCKIAMTAIAQSHGEESFQHMITSANTLDSRMSDCEASLGHIEAVDGELNKARKAVTQSVDRLVEVLAACDPFMQRLSQVMAAIAALGRKIPAAGSELPAYSPLLDRVYEMYSMTREREVHDRLLGRATQEPESTKPLELDDVFF